MHISLWYTPYLNAMKCYRLLDVAECIEKHIDSDTRIKHAISWIRKEIRFDWTVTYLRSFFKTLFDTRWFFEVLWPRPARPLFADSNYTKRAGIITHTHTYTHIYNDNSSWILISRNRWKSAQANCEIVFRGNWKILNKLLASDIWKDPPSPSPSSCLKRFRWANEW